MNPILLTDRAIVLHGDSAKIGTVLQPDSIDAIVTDPPAGISFMGKAWDGDKGGRDQWIDWLAGIMREAFRVLKPGGYALVWAIPRTSHWTAMALEDAGFEVRDVVMHLFGSGFPKSLDISKAIDGHLGAVGDVLRIEQRMNEPSGLQLCDGGGRTPVTRVIRAPGSPEAAQWAGWGTALKPAAEHWILARKPLVGTYAENVLAHGTGGLNIDATRITDASGSSRGGSTACTCRVREVAQTTDTLYNAPPASFDVRPAGQTLPLPSASSCESSRRAAPDSLAGCRVSPRSDDARSPSVAADDQGDVPSPAGVHTLPCPPPEVERTLEDRAKTCVHCTARRVETQGRWPAHLVLDEEAAALLDASVPPRKTDPPSSFFKVLEGNRFIYVAKAPKKDKEAGLEHLAPRSGGEATDRQDGSKGLENPRAGAGRTGGARNFHPTVKNTALMRWLCRLITPPGGTVLDLFAGSGSTLVAALEEGFSAIGVEMTDEYLPIIEGRVRHALKEKP